jgi:predicted Zn finger-like uncharacterized protein
MRLVCPNCDAKYEVPDDAIPDSGRDVQCANCGHAWFQMKPGLGAVAEAGPAPRVVADVVPAAMAGNDPAVDGPINETATRSAPEAVPAAAAATPYAVDDSVLAILREEAERETQARQSDMRPIETQPDLGVEAVALTPAQKRAAMLNAEDAEAAAKPSARRDLLPDVEEINSTLRPSEQTVDPDAEVDALPDLTRKRSSFRSGFMTMMVIAILGLVAYLAAPQLSTQVPALEQPLTAYVGFVDMLRLQLDGLMQSATVAINGDG